ncbi:hypothetical protein AAZX31_13G067400 [Glycine max]
MLKFCMYFFCLWFNFPLLLSIQIKIWDCYVYLFTRIRGKGAFLNGNPIKVSSQNELISSLLATEVSQTCYSLLCEIYFSFHIFFCINEGYFPPSSYRALVLITHRTEKYTLLQNINVWNGLLSESASFSLSS